MRKKFEFKEINIGFPSGITFRLGKGKPEERIKGFDCNVHYSVNYNVNNAPNDPYKLRG
ncbi:MAG: hypothetical protein U9O41_03455 [Candidatus Aerophobetes bacterium]|nr:hypothetical protein [Candidatus Aerophobetes bacterium]